jgi:DNA-binding transcriptional LysR family regulator
MFTIYFGDLLMLSGVTLDQLRILVTIEKTGSFSAAGRELRRVQSAISKAVQALERSQQIQLFDRTTKTPRFTEAGRVLAQQARQVLRQAELFQNTATTIAAGMEPELTVAADSIVPTEPLIASLRNLQTTFPNLPVALYTEGLWSAERRVRNGSAALALCAQVPAVAPDLHAERLTSITLVPVAAPTHPLATETRPLTRDVLSEHVQLILTDPSDSSGPSYGVVSPRIWRFVELARRLEFLLAGFGWATMPAHLVASHVADQSLVELDIDDPALRHAPIPIYVVHERTRPPRRGAAWLWEDLRARDWPA